MAWIFGSGFIRPFTFNGLGYVACLATMAAAIACSRHILPPKKEVKVRVVERTITIDSTVVEFIDTTICPPGLIDTLYVEKRVVKRLPPLDVIVRDTFTDTLTIVRDRQNIVTKSITKNNWWILIIGLLIGYYGKNYIRNQGRGD